MARNWNPVCRLSLSGSGGATGDLVAQGGGMKDLQVEFEIESHTLQSPDTADSWVTCWTQADERRGHDLDEGREEREV